MSARLGGPVAVCGQANRHDKCSGVAEHLVGSGFRGKHSTEAVPLPGRVGRSAVLQLLLYTMWSTSGVSARDKAEQDPALRKTTSEVSLIAFKGADATKTRCFPAWHNRKANRTCSEVRTHPLLLASLLGATALQPKLIEAAMGALRPELPVTQAALTIVWMWLARWENLELLVADQTSAYVPASCQFVVSVYRSSSTRPGYPG